MKSRAGSPGADFTSSGNWRPETTGVSLSGPSSSSSLGGEQLNRAAGVPPLPPAPLSPPPLPLLALASILPPPLASASLPPPALVLASIPPPLALAAPRPPAPLLAAGPPPAALAGAGDIDSCREHAKRAIPAATGRAMTSKGDTVEFDGLMTGRYRRSPPRQAKIDEDSVIAGRRARGSHAVGREQ
ncbi:hypothetical protein [Sorangium sp. So ce1099]|uniref:hypothetical protein n=1 Tax=Sorangium sp. So ce1099 TaxID=3133331 RepID=UPI003F61B7DD